MIATEHESSHPMNATAEFVFYDGACGLCHRGVRFLLVRDRDGSRFRFAPFGGATFERLVAPHARAQLPDSVVVLTRGGALLARSRAVRHVLVQLGGGWSVLARAASVVPPPLLDLVYDGIAKLRHKLFARPNDACPIATERMRRRFDP